MPKRFTQEEVEKCYLAHGYELLNKYKDTRYKNKIKELSTGKVYYQSYDSLRKGRRIGGKLSIDLIKEKGRKMGVELISNEYVNNITPLKWKDISTGKIFFRRWNDIKNGGYIPRNNKKTEFTSIRRDYDEFKRYIESFGGLGYKLLTTRNEYAKPERYYSNGERFILVTHPNLENTWKTTLSRFKNSAESRLSGAGKSYGETLIQSILTNNNISFDAEKTVTINKEKHRFDFIARVFNDKFYIEYDGRQHFEPIEHWGGLTSYKERQRRDMIKDNYVKNKNNCYMIRIPYTVCTQEKIIEILEENMKVKLLAGELHYIKNVDEKDIAEYYHHHSLLETVDKFNVDNKNIVTMCHKEYYGKCKRKNTPIKHMKDVISIANFYHTHSLSETTRLFSLGKDKVISFYKYVYGKSKGTKYVNQINTLYSIDVETGEKEEYSSVEEATIKYGCKKNHIYDCIRGTRKVHRRKKWYSTRHKV